MLSSYSFEVKGLLPSKKCLFEKRISSAILMSTVHVLGCDVTGMTNGSIIVSLIVYFEEDFSVSPEVSTDVSLVLKNKPFLH